MAIDSNPLKSPEQDGHRDPDLTNPTDDPGWGAQHAPNTEPHETAGRTLSTPTKTRGRKFSVPVFEVLLVYVLLLGAFLRLTPFVDQDEGKLKWGILWGESQWLHPDERFLLYVGGAISAVKDVPIDPNDQGATKRTWLSISDYFNTATSTLNPNNKGYSFFVYGTLPIFLDRYLAEIAFDHKVGWNEIAGVGRPLSALSDWLVIVLVYLAASRLFNKRVGLLAAVFYSWAVLPIQLSHYYKEDTFTNFFTFLAIYFAILIATVDLAKFSKFRAQWLVQVETGKRNLEPGGVGEAGEDFSRGYASQEGQIPSGITAKRMWRGVREYLTQPPLLYSLGFGFALGCAVASKILAAPVAVMLPIAFAVRIFSLPKEERSKVRWFDALLFVALGAFISLLTFRIFQPYAFTGPGFFNMGINKQWLEGILSQRAQTDFPPAMQWARRPFTFALKNLTVWGLGLPLGLLSWAGFLWAGWRMLRGEWQRLALPWAWTLGYFGFQMWQSHFNPTMRYFLPMYPTLVIFAAWLLVWLYDRRKMTGFSRLWRIAAILVGVFVLIYTFLYAYGFSRIYTRPITRLDASRWIFQNIPGPITLHFDTQDGQANQPMPLPSSSFISKVSSYNAAFEALENGSLVGVSLHNLAVLKGNGATSNLALSVTGPEDVSTRASIVIDTQAASLEKTQDYTFTFESPLVVQKGVVYRVDLSVAESGVNFTLEGDMVANEGDWDDGIPYSVDGYNPFGGIYPLRIDSLADYYTTQGVSYDDIYELAMPRFNMYWEEDTSEKYERFIRILDASDYIFITSNRQWGSLPRIPERFPMTTLYYRNLLGCPASEDVVYCFTVAEPGMYQGNLGFDLVATFTSNSSVGPFELNDQFAEEAFTVYDHPKVFIFRKTSAYDSQKVAGLLGTLDWTKTIHVYPDKAGSYPADLMLPSDRLEGQRQGGTWSEIFDTGAIYNRFQSLGVVLWYVVLFLLGLLIYPLLRLALRGLPDRGYPLARIAGLLLLSWLVWVAGSASIPFTRLTITVVFLFLAAVGVVLGYFQRRELVEEWRTRRNYFVMIELVMLAFFLFDLYLRWGNPDLWHPWKGGEKPMDFAYFNAILKSTTFPPYDPWWAGGYLNYYYYGFVFVGVLVKWLGLVPSFAYNLILPTLFSMTAMGAFSVAWNLYVKWEKQNSPMPWGLPPVFPNRETAPGNIRQRLAHFAALSWLKPSMPVRVGLAAGLLMVVLGNLGTVGMIVDGLERLGSPSGTVEKVSVTSHLSRIVSGTAKALSGERLPFPPGDWYWIPSRIIPSQGDTEAITEFPYFTFLYADLHAHMMAMPVAFLALAWAVSLVLGPGTKRTGKTIFEIALSFFIGALASGALYPINLSDRYTYLALGVVAVAYASWRYVDISQVRWLSRLPKIGSRALVAAIGVAIFVGLTLVLYSPYNAWYGQAYGSVDLWKGPRTPIGSYLSHWGLFLFIIVSWMFWETRDWMAHTPLSAARKLEPHMGKVFTVFCALVLLMAAHQAFVMGFLVKLNARWLDVSIAWLVIPLAAWAGVLILRPSQPESKRVVLFLTATGLAITLLVDTVVARGDIGRMNTVFKFYLQVWGLFAVSAAAALGWLWGTVKDWLPSWRIPWKIVLVGLVISTGLYTVIAGHDKVTDRMSDVAPHTLDGMAYMKFSTYAYNNVVIDTAYDYRAIRWMQENIEGSPVIVEANTGDNYRWFNRITMYTGLPSVLGYEWHQMQQRALLPSTRVHERLEEVMNFYMTPDANKARSFLEKYAVRYFIVGQLEQAVYSPQGLFKFTSEEGTLWRQVYPSVGEGDASTDPNETYIYEVIQP